LRTTTGNDRLSNTRNAHDNLLLHMQRKVVMGVLCNVRIRNAALDGDS
jgi:hypothetical protein